MCGDRAAEMRVESGGLRRAVLQIAAGPASAAGSVAADRTRAGSSRLAPRWIAVKLQRVESAFYVREGKSSAAGMARGRPADWPERGARLQSVTTILKQANQAGASFHLPLQLAQQP